MSIEILVRTPDCTTPLIQTTVTVVQPTQFTLTSNQSISTTIIFEGANVATLNSGNPTYIATAVGDYTVRMVGVCANASVWTSLIADPPVIGGGGGDGGGTGIVSACASDDGRLILLDTSVVPSVITELDGTPIGGGVTAVNCAGDLSCDIAPASGIVQYQGVGGAESKAFVFHDCEGNVVAYRDIVTNDLLVAPVIIVDTLFFDQTHSLSHGTDINIPAGAKSVVITRLTGTVVVDGGFTLDGSPYPQSISYDANELNGARGLLPAITLAGGTWQWSAVLPVAEV